MTFAREKRLLLGAASLLVALPLPFNQALEWPVLALYLAVVGLFIHRSAGGSEECLSTRALNLLGLAYLPILVLDLAATGRVQLVRPILHLTLFGLAAKLWSLRRERDKWQAWIGIFFLFLAAMSTSTHPSVMLYLLAFLALAVLLLVRFVHLHVLSSFGPLDVAPAQLRTARFIAGVVVATVLVAAPLFAILPRIRTPYVLGPGGVGAEPTVPRAGFSDQMSLDLIGRIRDNPEVAMRLQFSGRFPAPESLRLKASAYDRWEGRSWRQVAAARGSRRDSDSGIYRVSRAPTVGRVGIVLEPLRSRSLVLPVETVAVEIDRRGLTVDDGGALLLGGPPSAPIEYTAILGADPGSFASPPGPRAAAGGTLDRNGISERLSRLAADWAGDGNAGERASRIERRLLEEYEYTTAFLGRGGESPIETFLFESRSGHCEYFASSMVLLLRAEGIPARLVTGFYGAEWSPWERAWVVRQSNAHAWVEAWIEGRGWTGFDPTPPDGRPLANPRSVAHYLRQGWEAVVFRWDRWVISYDFDDQVSVLGTLRERWDELWARLFDGDRRAKAGAADGGAFASDGPILELGNERSLRGWWVAAGIAAIAAAVGGFVFWRQSRAVWSATRIYGRLRSSLRGAGLPVPDSLAPLALARLAGERMPAASGAILRVIDSYLLEAFAGRTVPEIGISRLRADLTQVERVVRRVRTRRGRGPRARRA